MCVSVCVRLARADYYLYDDLTFKFKRIQWKIVIAHGIFLSIYLELMSLEWLECVSVCLNEENAQNEEKE